MRVNPDPNCPICEGFGWVRRDVDDIHDPDFGKAFPCQCNVLPEQTKEEEPRE